MKQDNKKTKVLFLIERDKDTEATGIVFAYFPDNTYNAKDRTNFSYAHIGQHSACHPDYAKECSKATPEQYKDLKKELESIGYNLDVLNENEQALEDIYFSDLKNW